MEREDTTEAPVESVHKHLCKLLVSARERVGLSQRGLAAKLSWPLTTIARVETNERRLEVTEFILWCSALGVSPENILRTLRQHT
jgi:ribosome-binding protein aMBF1 (putative translation factor)